METLSLIPHELRDDLPPLLTRDHVIQAMDSEAQGLFYLGHKSLAGICQDLELLANCLVTSAGILHECRRPLKQGGRVNPFAWSVPGEYFQSFEESLRGIARQVMRDIPEP